MRSGFVADLWVLLRCHQRCRFTWYLSASLDRYMTPHNNRKYNPSLKIVLDLLNNKIIKYEHKYINHLQNYSKKKVTTFGVPQNLASGNAGGSGTDTRVTTACWGLRRPAYQGLEHVDARPRQTTECANPEFSSFSI